MRSVKNKATQLKLKSALNSMDIIVIAGDKGKSTTAHILFNILYEAGAVVGLASSDLLIAGKRREQNRTQQAISDTKELSDLIKSMEEQDVDKVIIEAPLDLIKEGAYSWLNPRVIAVTHSDSARYGGAINKLAGDKTKVICASTDDPNFGKIQKQATSEILSYGVDGGSTLNLIKAQMDDKKAKMTIAFQGETLDIRSSLLGKQNVYNTLCAISASIATSIPIGAIEKGIAASESLPGRMERIQLSGRKPKVILDSSSSPEQIELLLETVRNIYPNGKLLTVVGAPGNSPIKMRPSIGGVVARASDTTVITDVEPYNEDPMAIIRDIRNGITSNQNTEVIEEVNRKKAIQKTLKQAKVTDVVVILGLGNKKTRRVGAKDYSWDDRDIVEKFYDK